jgi:hypothetical protein
MKEVVLRIEGLATSCLSRARGKEAFAKLASLLGADPIRIDLDCVDTLSTSFLDEMILRLKESKSLKAVCFVTGRPLVKRKLSQISGVRCVEIYASATPTEPAVPVPRTSTNYKPEFDRADSH